MIFDTNVLVRAWSGDDARQSPAAERQLNEAERIHISSASLCEFVWVARQVYKQNRSDIAQAIRLLTSDPRVVIDGQVVDAGLAFLDAGGDFADGVIEFEGRRTGGETFVTFDKRAAAIMSSRGRKSLLLEPN